MTLPEPFDIVATAYHEAGHACVALVLSVRVRYATIKRDADSLGHFATALRFGQLDPKHIVPRTSRGPRISSARKPGQPTQSSEPSTIAFRCLSAPPRRRDDATKMWGTPFEQDRSRGGLRWVV